MTAKTGDEFYSIKEAWKSPEWPDWEKGIDTELGQLWEKGTWELVDQPRDAVPLNNKWVFIRKRDREGNIQRYKAWLVAKGYSQQPGHDYIEMHSPVVRLETICTILAIAITKGLEIQQMDVKGAYLNGTLKETIYMHQPNRYNNGSGRVYKLIKTLYGLKQSSREWNTKLNEKMWGQGFQRLWSEPCTYTHSTNNKIAIVTVWVDNLLLFADSVETMDKMKNDIRQEWDVTDMGEPTKIVGIEIAQTPRKISIAQKHSIETILQRQGLTNANPVWMPLNPNVKIVSNPDGNEGNKSNSFAELLGELQYIANMTRPDIAFTVNRLALYTVNPSMQHITTLKCILQYLSGTQEYEITYKSIPDYPTFKGFANAAYGDREDGKSTTGYVFLEADGTITWHSRKQGVTAQSSTEAEYIALWESGKEASWLRNLHRKLGFPQWSPTMLMCDNTGAVAIAKNPTFHKRTKHINSHYHWIREKVQAGRFNVDFCRTANQTANMLMKALPRPKHECHTKEMGVASVWRGV